MPPNYVEVLMMSNSISRAVAILTMILASCGPITSEASTFEFKKDRTIKLLNVVDGRMAVESMSTFDRLSRSGEPIHVLINSPGGSIFAGNLIINAMRMAKERGSSIHCVSTVYAASMAFQFLMECTHRYAMRYSQLLFHPPRISTQEPLLADDLRRYADALEEIETKMIPIIRQVLGGMSDDEFLKHYHLETWWDAADLIEATNTGWLHLITNVEGLDNVFQLQPERPFSIFGVMDRTPALIWIAPNSNGRIERSE